MRDPYLDKIAAELASLRNQVGELNRRPAPLNFGTSFPSGWPNNIPFYRADLGFWCFYDGTRWLTCQEYTCILGVSDSPPGGFSATQAVARLGLLRSDYTVRFTRGQATYSVGAINNAANNITYAIRDNTATTIWTWNTGGANPDTPGTNVTRTIGEGSFNQPSGIRTFVYLDMTVFGSPSAQFPRTPILWYRLVIP